jgi:vanillate O-demethylase monooxygenase subunit
MSYPLGTEQPFPKNRWYIAAFSHELTQEPIQRLILDTPVALYRTSEGKAVAMYGLCPHRYYPLGLGKVDGDALVCGYHGFAFSSSGKCVRIPSQGTGAGFTQPTYPLEERGYLLWIWMGDVALADRLLIPPYVDFGLDQPGWATSGHDYFELQGRAQLLVDNLLDLTHLPHIHHHLPGGDVFLKATSSTLERARSFRLEQEFTSEWTPFLAFLWGEECRFGGSGRFLSVTDFYGPELIRTSGPLLQSIEGEQEMASGVGETYFLHGITPSSRNTTHYFCFQTRNYRTDDEKFGKKLGELDRVIRQQDCDAIAAVEPWVDRGSATQPELLAKSDRPAAIVRRKIQDMILAEESGPAVLHSEPEGTGSL